MMTLLWTLVIGLLWCSVACAANISVAWNTAVQGTNPVTGYKLYYGTASNTYSTEVDVGLVLGAEVTGLSAGTMYYFAVAAYSVDGESIKSAEISKVATDPAIVPKPYSSSSYPR